MLGVDTKTRVTLTVPNRVADAYLNQAVERGVEMEDVMATRLERCVEHTSGSPLYFDDAQRGELVHILGGHLIPDATAALNRLRAFSTLTIGNVEVSLDERLLNRLNSRAKAERTTVEKLIEREALKGLRQFAGLF